MTSANVPFALAIDASTNLDVSEAELMDDSLFASYLDTHLDALCIEDLMSLLYLFW